MRSRAGRRPFRHVRRTTGRVLLPHLTAARTLVPIVATLLVVLNGTGPAFAATAPRDGTAPTASLNLTDVAGTVNQSFWSVNAQTSNPNGFRVDPNIGLYLNQSGDNGITFVRYNAGADDCNETTNQMYDASGVVTGGCPSNITAFKGWCDSLTPACRSVIEIPGENNNSAEDAAIVRDIVRTRGFQPTYFAIGNEPTAWTHYGEPWTSWRPTDNSTPTPTDYAWDVHNAIAAIRTVDPTAAFVGLEAAGPFNPTFTTADLEMNAPNISAMAVHLYPHPPGGNGGAEPLALYLAGLDEGTAALPTPVEEYDKFNATVHDACAACANITVQIGEFNGGPGAGPAPYENTEFPGAVYLAAAATQFLNAGARTLQVFKLQGGTNPCPDCLMNASANDSVDPEGQFLALFPHLLGSGIVRNTSVVSAASNLWATTVVDGSTTTVLFVNANITTPSVDLSLDPVPFPSGASAVVQLWSGASLVTARTEALPSVLSVPSLSILLVQVSGGSGPPSGVSLPAIAVGAPSSFGVPQGIGSAAIAIGVTLVIFRRRLPAPGPFAQLPAGSLGLIVVAGGTALMFVV